MRAMAEIREFRGQKNCDRAGVPNPVLSTRDAFRGCIQLFSDSITNTKHYCLDIHLKLHRGRVKVVEPSSTTQHDGISLANRIQLQPRGESAKFASCGDTVIAYLERGRKS
jgi:hypothetical protein